MSDLLFKLRVLRWMLMDSVEQWRAEVWQRDLDSSYCCDGRECGCMATTVRELWSHNAGLSTPSIIRGGEHD